MNKAIQGVIDGRATTPSWGSRRALALAAAMVLSGVALDAQALVLGAIAMRSSLGEPLRAEIEVPQISADEAASLQASLASRDSFRALGVDYTPALASARVSLHRRANGQAYLRLAGDQPVHEPILGVVIEAHWAGGRIVRHYTLLVDPPDRATLPPVAVTPAQVAPPVAAAPPRPRPAPVQAPVSPAEPVVRASPRTAPATPPVAAPAPARAAPGPARATAPSESNRVRVRRGDTAYRIASAHAPEGVSLDQMLVALLRTNPGAFIQGNVNRMKAGAVLTIPTAEQAGAVPADTARSTLTAHSRDFQSYRRAMAQSARAAPVEAPGRSAAGAVQTRVRDAAATPSQDRLTLARDGQPASQEAALAQSRQAQDQDRQVAQLNQNISELSRLQAESGTAGASTSPAAAASGPAAAASAAPAASATPVAASAPTGAAAPSTSPTPASSALESLPGYPQVLWGAAAILALLAALGLVRSRQRRQAAAEPTAAFLREREPGERVAEPTVGSFGAATAGAAVAAAAASTTVRADPEPTAEAEALMAYGRDNQAEQALREAIHAQRSLVPNHLKLAEIYAARQDTLALESVALEAYDITQGEGQDWQQIARLGQRLDPDNALYSLGVSMPAPPLTPPPAPVAAETPVAPAASAPALDDLYVSLDLEPLPDDMPAVAPPATTPPPAFAPLDFDLDLDFAPPATSPTPVADAAVTARAAPPDTSDLIDFSLDDLAPATAAAAAAAPQPDALESLLVTKLELARKYQAIGDVAGARSLAADVLAEGSGALREQAEELLARLG